MPSRSVVPVVAALAAETVTSLGFYAPVERRHWAFRPRSHPEISRFSNPTERQWAKSLAAFFVQLNA